MVIKNGKTFSAIFSVLKKVIKIYKGILLIYNPKYLEEETNIVLNDILSFEEDTETVIDMTEEEINETLDYIIGG